MNSDRFSAIKCLICATCIGALFTAFMALFDRWDAKNNPEQVTRIEYREAK